MAKVNKKGSEPKILSFEDELWRHTGHHPKAREAVKKEFDEGRDFKFRFYANQSDTFGAKKTVEQAERDYRDEMAKFKKAAKNVSILETAEHLGCAYGIHEFLFGKTPGKR